MPPEWWRKWTDDDDDCDEFAAEASVVDVEVSGRAANSTAAAAICPTTSPSGAKSRNPSARRRRGPMDCDLEAEGVRSWLSAYPSFGVVITLFEVVDQVLQEHFTCPLTRRIPVRPVDGWRREISQG
ncbi:polyketide synthase [Colletotrichum scovillei]|uniref:Polyketide synthase n=1 Tax=Colletotrichum scovillei TaxID=1209932 RepID=A0A9P7R7Y8_9PEZI|nr:polyketide synthase [Colletotrichum scovillei]KAG7069618.1 polyketide synthase [Colletotrichum scovillei]KAG7073550.1 polyketide synthase [Colletotrichum scovillei]